MLVALMLCEYNYSGNELRGVSRKWSVTWFRRNSFHQLSRSLHHHSVSKSVGQIPLCPASIFERSRMSLISCKSSVLFSMILTWARLVSPLLPSVAEYSEKPTIALSVVRISWLMLARKADLSQLDSSARVFSGNQNRFPCFFGRW